jgi:hypothetical protein
MGAKCSFRGSARLDLNRMKLGKQKCPICRAEIIVTESGDLPGYGVIPWHDKPARRKP